MTVEKDDKVLTIPDSGGKNISVSVSGIEKDDKVLVVPDKTGSTVIRTAPIEVGDAVVLLPDKSGKRIAVRADAVSGTSGSEEVDPCKWLSVTVNPANPTKLLIQWVPGDNNDEVEYDISLDGYLDVPKTGDVYRTWSVAVTEADESQLRYFAWHFVTIWGKRRGRYSKVALKAMVKMSLSAVLPFLGMYITARSSGITWDYSKSGSTSCHINRERSALSGGIWQMNLLYTAPSWETLRTTYRRMWIDCVFTDPIPGGYADPRGSPITVLSWPLAADTGDIYYQGFTDYEATYSYVFDDFNHIILDVSEILALPGDVNGSRAVAFYFEGPWTFGDIWSASLSAMRFKIADDPVSGAVSWWLHGDSKIPPLELYGSGVNILNRLDGGHNLASITLLFNDGASVYNTGHIAIRLADPDNGIIEIWAQVAGVYDPLTATWSQKSRDQQLYFGNILLCDNIRWQTGTTYHGYLPVSLLLL